jgi:hypothetical protein
LRLHGQLDEAGAALMRTAFERLGLSARAYHASGRTFEPDLVLGDITVEVKRQARSPIPNYCAV